MSGASWTNSFGASPIVPADPSYSAITIATNTQLVWPTETLGGEPSVSKQIDVTASAGSLQLLMPPGNTGSNGPQALITNVGSNTFTVTDTGGNAIAVIPTTQTWLITLTDNSTVNGSWRALQIASTTSTATAAALAGPGLQASAGLLQTRWPTQSFAVSDTITPAMRSNALIWTGAVGTLQFNASATLTEGWFCAVKNDGTNTCTLQCTGPDTINGQGSIDLVPGDSGLVILGPAGAFQTFGALVTVLAIASGGTGATSAGEALVNLGGSDVGISIFTAPDVAAIIALLGLNGSTFTEASVSTNQVQTSLSGNTVYVCTAALSITMPLSTSLTRGFVFMVDSGGGDVVLTPQAADAINGFAPAATLTVPQGGFALVCTDANGNWYTLFGPSMTLNELVVTGSITPSSTNGIIATTTNDNAITGRWGSTLLSDSSGSVSSATLFNLTSFSVPAGDWDLDGYLTFLATAGGQIQGCQAAIGPTSATLAGMIISNSSNGAVNNSMTIVFPRYRVSLAGATTHYLVGLANSSAGSITVSGRLYARRAR